MKTDSTFLNLIPQPLECCRNEGYWTHAKVLTLYTPDSFAEDCAVFAEQLVPQNIQCSIIQADSPRPDTADGVILLEEDSSITKEEGYTLTISQEVLRIQAGSSAGAYYALQTVRQALLTAEPIENTRTRIPCARIKDLPQFEWRGFMLDTVRTFFSPSFIKKLIDAASLHKLNRFHWHLTDDQGWRLPVDGYPNLTETGSVPYDPRFAHETGRIFTAKFYTHQQIRDIVQYAQKRHVTIVPEIETPGHASAILASYPQLGCTGGPYHVEGRYGIFPDVLCPGQDEVFTVLKAVFKTVAELFPGPYIHIGGDECPHTRWETCPRCQARIKENELDSAKQLQSWMTAKVAAIIEENGKIPIGWDEVLENTEKVRIPENLIVMSWQGNSGGIKAAKMHHKTIMAPTTEGCYLDYPHLPDCEEPGLMECTTVKKSYDYSPIPHGFPQSEISNILGGQGNIWTELMSFSRWVEYMIFPRLCALSEALWLPKEQKDFSSFEKRLPVHKDRLDKLDFLYYKGKLN